MVKMQPKMKRKYKTKYEKEKNVIFEELVAIGKPMVEGDLLEDETQSQRDLMEEEVVMTPRKQEKEGEGWGWAKQSFDPRKDSFPHCPKQGRN
jgi:hypothetical protein